MLSERREGVLSYSMSHGLGLARSTDSELGMKSVQKQIAKSEPTFPAGF